MIAGVRSDGYGRSVPCAKANFGRAPRSPRSGQARQAALDILRFLGNAPLVSGGTNYAEGASAILPAGPPTG